MLLAKTFQPDTEVSASTVLCRSMSATILLLACEKSVFMLATPTVAPKFTPSQRL